MRKISLYILIIAALGLSSCEKIVQNVDVPVVEEQLVLFSFISPEETYTKVELTLSKPVFSNRPQTGELTFVKDATVVLKDGAGNSTTLLYVDSAEAYMVSASVFPVIPGQTYTITASGAGKSVNATCTVPSQKVDLSQTKYARTATAGSGGTVPFFRYSYEWHDIPGQTNYYLVSTMYAYIYSETLPDTAYSYICEGVTFSDAGNDGGILKGVCEDYNDPWWSGPHSQVMFFLLNTDIHYYEYHRRRAGYDGGNPFSEPYEQYSNVKGGLGVFCSYRKTKTMMAVQ